MTGKSTQTTFERFLKYVNPDARDPGACWEWQGHVMKNGYGTFMWDGYISRLAHRYSYLRFVGEIPDGLDIDHLCRNRSCVNPLHLEAVTRAENLRRGTNRWDNRRAAA